MSKTALYLAGGGARGAYQAGVLKAIYDILRTKTIPFTMISGVSVGSLNAAILAEHADDFQTAVAKLVSLWSEIHCHHIFNSSNYELSKSVARNFSRMFIKQRKSGFLLDTSPLHQFITTHIDFNKIKENIAQKHLETMEVISNCYETQQTISFYHHYDTFEDWHYPRHISQRTDLNFQHILASSALPLFFPAVKIQGLHYGDGSMGLVSPLRGVVRFDVSKVLIIGTRPLPGYLRAEPNEQKDIGFANILGSMLSGLFLDNLDRDNEMVNRMNDISRLLSMWKKRNSPWRPIDTIFLRPSDNISQIAQNKYNSMPALLRMLLNVLGAQSHSGDLLSFLLFEKEFTKELITLGYQDTTANSEHIAAFFNR